jgi:hypothetical protein
MPTANEIEVPENWDTLDDATKHQWVAHWDALIAGEVRAKQQQQALEDAYARNTAQQAARQEQQRQAHTRQ